MEQSAVINMLWHDVTLIQTYPHPYHIHSLQWLWFWSKCEDFDGKKKHRSITKFINIPHVIPYTSVQNKRYESDRIRKHMWHFCTPFRSFIQEHNHPNWSYTSNSIRYHFRTPFHLNSIKQQIKKKPLHIFMSIEKWFPRGLYVIFLSPLCDRYALPLYTRNCITVKRAQIKNAYQFVIVNRIKSADRADCV